MKINSEKVQDRQSAGKVLAGKIAQLRIADAVVVGVPTGGVVVAASVAKELGLPLEVMSCDTIQNPTDRSKCIGSVGSDEALFHDNSRKIQQDSLNLLVATLRNKIRHQQEFYYGSDAQVNLGSKSVILVDDWVKSPDEIAACLLEIRAQRPLNVVVAVPFIEAEAAKVIEAQADKLVLLRSQHSINSPLDFYDNFPPIDDWVVRGLLKKSLHPAT
jgi:putative phosphoribosyl transferase